MAFGTATVVTNVGKAMVADRIRTDVLPSGINHVTLALADRRMALDWAGIELPELPLLDDQVRLIGTRIVPALADTAQSTS